MSRPRSTEWQKSYLSFDAEGKEWSDAASDTQVDFLLGCVGSKRCSYWDGAGWQHREGMAKRMSRAEACDAMALEGNSNLWDYLRVIRQPKGWIDLPTVNGMVIE